MEIYLDDLSRQRARKSRDARFDGLFFIAVKTTGIYCRPICPANSPLEKNVEYYDTAVSAAGAGFRPCLRCRPDAAPQSSAWLGSQTSFQRAIKLINEGALQTDSLQSLSARLGISDRYLRELFQQNLGTSPKKYATYQQCLFAKQLLHESRLPITDIAYASGFNSVRRFNEAMQQQIGLTPREIRKSDKVVTSHLQLKLHYRPPFDWAHTWRFLQNRVIDGLEWLDGESYSRTIEYQGTRGWFTIRHAQANRCLLLELQLDDYRYLNPITHRIRSLFDVDAPIAKIDAQLSEQLCDTLVYAPGIRIPGIWGSFEAGIRAILGQQVSVVQAMQLVTTLVDKLGEEIRVGDQQLARLFPRPERVADHALDFFRMPQARKDTVRRLAQHFLDSPEPDDVDAWLDLKGIGPWTVNYAKIRATKDPDVWLAGDAGIKNALQLVNKNIDVDRCQPWRSYLTFQLWNQLALRNSA